MSAEQRFWKWFEEHEDELFHFERDQGSTFDRLAAALSEIDDDLTFEFGPERNGGREFVISAAGSQRRGGDVNQNVTPQRVLFLSLTSIMERHRPKTQERLVFPSATFPLTK